MPLKFVSNTDSSVFTAVTEILLRHPHWEVVSPAFKNISVWLGDGRKINSIPYERLERATQPTAAATSRGGVGGAVNPKSRVRLVNYLRGLNSLTLKSVLVRTMWVFCEENRLDILALIPESYVVYPTAMGTPRSNDERHMLYAASSRRSSKYAPSVWIAKSSSGGRGEGIIISENPYELTASIDAQARMAASQGMKNGATSAWVIQKYITNPLLLNGRKFDIRAWVLVDDHYEPHIFSEGVLRTASQPFSLENLSDNITHLTNHCIQETSPLFSLFEAGNELSFFQFDTYLRKELGVSFYTHILPQIHEIVALSLMAARRKVTLKKGVLSGFQLLGYDFMVDDELNVLLIEVNGSPASRALLLPDMAQGIVDTVIDRTFPPPPAYFEVQRRLRGRGRGGEGEEEEEGEDARPHFVPLLDSLSDEMLDLWVKCIGARRNNRNVGQAAAAATFAANNMQQRASMQRGGGGGGGGGGRLSRNDVADYNDDYDDEAEENNEIYSGARVQNVPYSSANAYKNEDYEDDYYPPQQQQQQQNQNQQQYQYLQQQYDPRGAYPSLYSETNPSSNAAAAKRGGGGGGGEGYQKTFLELAVERERQKLQQEREEDLALERQLATSLFLKESEDEERERMRREAEMEEWLVMESLYQMFSTPRKGGGNGGSFGSPRQQQQQQQQFYSSKNPAPLARNRLR